MFLIDIASVILALLLVFFTYFKYKYQYWKKKNVPYIEPTVPWGSFQTVLFSNKGIAEHVNDSYHTAKEKKWDYYGTYSFDRAFLAVTDLELIKKVMTKDFNHFTDRGGYVNEKHQPISAHLFAIGGVKWRNLRTKFTPTFTSGKMRTMFQTLADCGTILEKYINEISGNKNEGIDIKNVLGCFSTDIIGSVAFGLECNTLNEPDSPFRYYSKKIVDRSKLEILKVSFAASFPRFAGSLGIVVFPKDVEKFFNDVVRETVEYREKNHVERKDFMQLLIDIKNNKEGSGATGDGTNLTLDEMVAQSFVFFFAGHETSSTTMTFALYELAVHQNIQDKVREEIHRVLKKHDDKITYDSLKEMEYLQQVIDETLRLFPPVPLVTRQCVEDYKVPNTDLVIDKDTRVIIPIKGIHYDKEIYPNPTIFDPERFSTEQKNSRHQYAYIPFGEGPRICIGMRFGIMQTKVGIVSILRNHRVNLNKKTQTPFKLKTTSFFPQVEGGIWLDIEKA